MKQRHAEIVGAGFAGLTAACALAQRGWSVRVHERADRLRTTGAGIYIYENGLRVLEAVGAYAAATHGAPFAHTREVRDDQNRVISVHRWQGSRVFSIVRQTVINALAESATLSGAEIVLNSTAVSATPDGELTLADGQHDQGRPGGRRRRLELAAARRPRASRQAQVPGRRLHAAADRQDAGGDGQPTAPPRSNTGPAAGACSTRPCSETEVYIALTMLDSDEAAKEIPVDRDAWKRWFPHLEPLIGRIRAAGRYDRFEYIKLKRWSAGKVAVIGDAAHAIPPNIGQGGGCAMMNALSLAVYLDREHDTPAALATWEGNERAITEHTQRISLMLGWPTTWPPYHPRQDAGAGGQIEMAGRASAPRPRCTFRRGRIAPRPSFRRRARKRVYSA